MNLHAIAHRVAISARQVVARSIWWPRQPVAAHVRGVSAQSLFQAVRARRPVDACVLTFVHELPVRSRAE